MERTLVRDIDIAQLESPNWIAVSKLELKLKLDELNRLRRQVGLHTREERATTAAIELRSLAIEFDGTGFSSRFVSAAELVEQVVPFSTRD